MFIPLSFISFSAKTEQKWRKIKVTSKLYINRGHIRFFLTKQSIQFREREINLTIKICQIKNGAYDPVKGQLEEATCQRRGTSVEHTYCPGHPPSSVQAMMGIETKFSL